MREFLLRFLSAVTFVVVGFQSAIADGAQIKILDQSSSAVEHAVVSLSPLFETKSETTSADEWSMQQAGALFSPFVLPIRRGATVSFPNFDEFRHHVYSFSKAKRFQLRLYGQDETKQIQFDKTGIVALGCNIHDNMLAYIYVTDNSLFKTTGASGSVEFEGLAAGEYEIHVWHPDMKDRDDQNLGKLVVSDNTAGAMPNTLTLQLRKVRKIQSAPAEDDYS